jgi:hypothetical protein
MNMKNGKYVTRDKLLIVFFIASTFLLMGCRDEKLKGYDQFFLSRNLEQQHEVFKKLPLEKQYELYIHQMTKMHPPDLSFADDIAQRGYEAVPFLKNKLELEKEELVQESILLVFESMVKYQHMDLKSDKELMKLIEDKVSKMKYPYSKKFSEEHLKVILGD